MCGHHPRFLAGVFAVVLSVGGITTTQDTAAASRDVPFCDVPAESYYHDAVAWAKSEGITAGTTEQSFEPDGRTSRAQLMTLLYRFVGWRDGGTLPPPAAHTFTDVPSGAFFADAVGWAVATGLTTGISATTFGPDRPTTRAELAVFVHRLTTDPIDGGTAPFHDVDQADWFHDAIAWMAAEGLTTGTSPGAFDPGATTDRAQIVTFLWRLAGSPTPGDHPLPRCENTWTAVGDSVMAGAETDALLSGATFSGWTGHVDAGPCRTALVRTRWPPCGPDEVPSTLEVISHLNATDQLGEVVMVHAGTNGPLDAAAIDQLIDAASSARVVWLITIRGSWVSNQTIENQAIADAVDRWEGRRDVRMLDWHGLAERHTEWISDDGVHLSEAGRFGFVEMMAGALAES